MATTAFRFRFQTILEARERQERALKIELARLGRAIGRQKAAAGRWEAAREDALDQMRRARERADLQGNDDYDTYLRHVRAQIQRSSDEIARLGQARDAVRAELEKVMQARKAIENYRDRMARQFAVEQERAEERLNEVHSLTRFGRVRRAS